MDFMMRQIEIKPLGVSSWILLRGMLVSEKHNFGPCSVLMIVN